MQEQLGEALVGAARRFASQIGSDPAYRAGLRALARIVLEATEIASEPKPESETTPAPAPDLRVDRGAESTPAAPASPPAPRGPLPPLTLGQAPPRPTAPEIPIGFVNDRRDSEEVGLEIIARRCLLRAEATRWAANPPPIGPERSFAVNALIERAKAYPDCYLWMLQPQASLIAYRPEMSELLAQGYEAVAASCDMIIKWTTGPSARDEPLARAVLSIAAEAQSALRIAVEDLGGRKDTDQVAMYNRLRDEGYTRQIFIDRYMKLADPADPRNLPEIRRRMSEVVGRIGSVSADGKNREKRAKTMAYHARHVLQGTGGDVDYHWRKIAEAADLAVAEGVPPSSPELREILLPIFDAMPDLDGLPRGFDLVYREIDRYLATIPDDHDDEPYQREPTPEVLAVADALRGKIVVFIGGVPRPHNRERLRSAFNLAELDWVETREHQSIESFEYDIARPEVALVIVAIRWSSHSFEGAKEFCERHGKPMLRLKAGYSPNQVAEQIVRQCSEQLGIGVLERAEPMLRDLDGQ